MCVCSSVYTVDDTSLAALEAFQPQEQKKESNIVTHPCRKTRTSILQQSAQEIKNKKTKKVITTLKSPEKKRGIN